MRVGLCCAAADPVWMFCREDRCAGVPNSDGFCGQISGSAPAYDLVIGCRCKQGFTWDETASTCAGEDMFTSMRTVFLWCAPHCMRPVGRKTGGR
jgi:hypothetical protein